MIEAVYDINRYRTRRELEEIKEGEVKIEPRKLTTLLFQVIVKSHVEELKEEGLIDSIEDVQGGEIMWLTNKDKDENKGL